MCKICNALLVTSCALLMSGMTAFTLPNIDHLSLLPGDDLTGHFPSSLKFVGTADGKSYFAENATRLNWTDAGEYCDALGMRLATITSASQVSLLNQSHGAHFAGFFWTAGRDAHELRQFSWNGTGAPLNPDYLSLGVNFRDYRTCLCYYSRAVQSRLDSEDCAYTEHVLCETVC